MIIFSVVGVILFIAAVAAASFAFYTSTTKTEGDGASFETTTKKISSSLKDDNAINITNMIPGDSFEKTFTLTNDGETEFTYKIILSDYTNNFTKPDDLVYTLTTDDKVSTGTFTKTEDSPTEFELSKETETIGVGETKTYTLKIEYKNTEIDQKDDMGKTISGKLYYR